MANVGGQADFKVNCIPMTPLATTYSRGLNPHVWKFNILLRMQSLLHCLPYQPLLFTSDNGCSHRGRQRCSKTLALSCLRVATLVWSQHKWASHLTDAVLDRPCSAALWSTRLKRIRAPLKQLQTRCFWQPRQIWHKEGAVSRGNLTTKGNFSEILERIVKHSPREGNKKSEAAENTQTKRSSAVLSNYGEVLHCEGGGREQSSPSLQMKAKICIKRSSCH